MKYWYSQHGWILKIIMLSKIRPERYTQYDSICIYKIYIKLYKMQTNLFWHKHK